MGDTSYQSSAAADSADVERHQVKRQRSGRDRELRMIRDRDQTRLSSWTSSPITSSTLSRTGFLEVDGRINELNMICNLVTENVSYQSLLSFRTLPTFLKFESHWPSFSTTLYRVDGEKKVKRGNLRIPPNTSSLWAVWNGRGIIV
jgi:hypothetical protein